MWLENSWRIIEKQKFLLFMKIQPVGEEFLYADRQTDSTVLKDTFFNKKESVQNWARLYTHKPSYRHLWTGTAVN